MTTKKRFKIKSLQLWPISGELQGYSMSKPPKLIDVYVIITDHLTKSENTSLHILGKAFQYGKELEVITSDLTARPPRR